MHGISSLSNNLIGVIWETEILEKFKYYLLVKTLPRLKQNREGSSALLQDFFKVFAYSFRLINDSLKLFKALPKLFGTLQQRPCETVLVGGGGANLPTWNPKSTAAFTKLILVPVQTKKSVLEFADWLPKFAKLADQKGRSVVRHPSLFTRSSLFKILLRLLQTSLDSCKTHRASKALQNLSVTL